MSLYNDLTSANIQVSSWQSDLYFPVSPEASAILAKHPKLKLISSTFTSNIDGKRWYEVPFAFDPFWNKGE